MECNQLKLHANQTAYNYVITYMQTLLYNNHRVREKIVSISLNENGEKILDAMQRKQRANQMMVDEPERIFIPKRESVRKNVFAKMNVTIAIL